VIQPNLSNTWFKGSSSNNGKRTNIRVRQHLKNAFDADIYKNRIEIIWNYAGNEFGLPVPEMLDTINQTENLLNSIEQEQHSIHLVTITGNCNVIWIWYTKNEQLFMDGLHKSLENSEKLPLEILFEYDSEWEYYLEVLEKCGLELD
jgi:hypothetical protein